MRLSRPLRSKPVAHAYVHNGMLLNRAKDTTCSLATPVTFRVQSATSLATADGLVLVNALLKFLCVEKAGVNFVPIEDPTLESIYGLQFSHVSIYR
jgi:hypothetical protein